jgi:hypothetical protein
LNSPLLSERRTSVATFYFQRYSGTQRAVKKRRLVVYDDQNPSQKRHLVSVLRLLVGTNGC